MKSRKNRKKRDHCFFRKHARYTRLKIESMTSEELLIYCIDFFVRRKGKDFLFRKWFAQSAHFELAKRYMVSDSKMREAIFNSWKSKTVNYKTCKFEYKLSFKK